MSQMLRLRDVLGSKYGHGGPLSRLKLFAFFDPSRKMKRRCLEEVTCALCHDLSRLCSQILLQLTDTQPCAIENSSANKPINLPVARRFNSRHHYSNSFREFIIRRKIRTLRVSNLFNAQPTSSTNDRTCCDYCKYRELKPVLSWQCLTSCHQQYTGYMARVLISDSGSILSGR
jgi:hypothetical protein